MSATTNLANGVNSHMINVEPNMMYSPYFDGAVFDFRNNVSNSLLRLSLSAC